VIAEQRLEKLRDNSNLREFSDEWEEYRYWDYALACLSREGVTSLMSALVYSRAFVDEDDRLIIYVLSEKAADIVKRYEGLILHKVNGANLKNLFLKSMEVYAIQ
jgi:hypothetical protein